MTKTIEAEEIAQRLVEKIRSGCRVSGGVPTTRVEKDGTYVVTCIFPSPRDLTVSIDRLINLRMVSIFGFDPKEVYRFSSTIADEIGVRADDAKYVKLDNVGIKANEPSLDLKYEIEGKYRGIKISYNPKKRKLVIDLLKEPWSALHLD